jgi:hypothetical protein
MRFFRFVSVFLGLSAINAQVISNALERRSIASTIANEILKKLEGTAGCAGCEVSCVFCYA